LLAASEPPFNPYVPFHSLAHFPTLNPPKPILLIATAPVRRPPATRIYPHTELGEKAEDNTLGPEEIISNGAVIFVEICGFE